MVADVPAIGEYRETEPDAALAVADKPATTPINTTAPDAAEAVEDEPVNGGRPTAPLAVEVVVAVPETAR